MMLKLFKRDESFGAMLEDVLYFKAEGHYTNVFFTRDSKMLLPYGLSQLDNEIWKLDNGTCFVKVGRSHIVNLKKVVYACITKESFTLMDQNGNFTNIVVSRAAIKQLIKALKDGKASKEEKSDSDNNNNDLLHHHYNKHNNHLLGRKYHPQVVVEKNQDRFYDSDGNVDIE